MHIFGPQAQHVIAHPGRFFLQAVKAFRANQGLLLAGAVAYYALLSIVPLLILSVIALSHVIDQAELLATIGRYLEWLIPGQSRAIVGELGHFLADRGYMGWVLLATMLFFSSLAFSVLESAMSVIFIHRVAVRRGRFVFSALMPYCYILSLGVGLLLVTIVATAARARRPLSGPDALASGAGAGRGDRWCWAAWPATATTSACRWWPACCAAPASTP